ncbi:MAG: hypothetical protein ACP5Q4_10270, partial [Candidatus Caldatribacteriaceae bacterium]
RKDPPNDPRESTLLHPSCRGAIKGILTGETRFSLRSKWSCFGGFHKVLIAQSLGNTGGRRRT